MLDFNVGPSHKYVLGGMILIKKRVQLASIWYVCYLSLKTKNQKSILTRLV